MKIKITKDKDNIKKEIQEKAMKRASEMIKLYNKEYPTIRDGIFEMLIEKNIPYQMGYKMIQKILMIFVEHDPDLLKADILANRLVDNLTDEEKRRLKDKLRELE